MEKEIIVKTLNLTKQYKNKCAVDSVSLTIQKGEIYGLVGKNGAGKTTLIRLLCGVIHSTAGGYSLFGFDKEKDLLKVRQKVAAMIETPSLYLNLSAEDNLKARCILMHKDFSIIKSRLMEVGLKDVIGSRKKVKDFSLGMRQRLGIAISILGDPELLILDEPTNGLDPEGIKEMRDLLVSLNQNRGVTIIVSSHILSELSKFATKYGFMDKGKIIKEISSDELFRSCKKSLDIELKTQNDLQKMTPLLEGIFSKDDVLIEGLKVSIFGIEDVASFLKTIFSEGIEISYFKENENGLEDYYLSLLEEDNKWEHY